MTQESVEYFKDEYEAFSNFFPVTIFYKGKRYPTVEHAYVAAKSFDPEFHKAISEIPSHMAGKAKRMGRKIQLRSDWEEKKVEIMKELLRQKFSVSFLRELLISTDNVELIEGNWWHDNFWGDCKCKKCTEIPGTNMLGKLLMEIREELKE